MQQVHSYQAGVRSYIDLRGGTGPLVYPAGFVHLFDALQWITQGDLRTAQVLTDTLVGCLCIMIPVFEILTTLCAHVGQCCEATTLPTLRPEDMMQVIFWGAYLMTQSLVMRLYIISERTPPYLLLVLTLSKRVHSIFVLRLFNDAWTMLATYLALNFLVDRHWTLAIFVFAAAVSVKMNALLFAPGVVAMCLKVPFQAECKLPQTVHALMGGCAVLCVRNDGAPRTRAVRTHHVCKCRVQCHIKWHGVLPAACFCSS